MALFLVNARSVAVLASHRRHGSNDPLIPRENLDRVETRAQGKFHSAPRNFQEVIFCITDFSFLPNNFFSN